ncbi:CYTH domain-containing protein [Patescibacteria group bacterium]|nr:MAG: CYTH domain-containing protein [Patescibacteria group bacterium]
MNTRAAHDSVSRSSFFTPSPIHCRGMAYNNLEIEVKLAIPDRAGFDTILAAAEARAIPGLEISTFVGPLVRYDFYFDTPDRKLLAAGMLLRVGIASSERAKLTVKKNTDDRRTRTEIEEVMPPAEAMDAVRWKKLAKPMDLVREAVGEVPMTEQIRVSKVFWALHGIRDGGVWNATFGSSTFIGPRGTAERYDLEVEAEEGATAETVEAVAKIIGRHFSLMPVERSKYQIGLELVG